MKLIFSVGVPWGVPLTIDTSARQSLSLRRHFAEFDPGLLLVGVEEVHGFVLAAHGHRAPVAGVPSILVLVIACMGEAPRLPKSFNPE